jgi:hypothetical protein
MFCDLKALQRRISKHVGRDPDLTCSSCFWSTFVRHKLRERLLIALAVGVRGTPGRDAGP